MRILAVAIALGSCALSPTAQSGVAGATTTISPARNLPALGGVSSSASTTAESELGLATGGPVVSSASYRFEGGAVWTQNGFQPSGPVVFGLESAFPTAGAVGASAGGEAETVLGLGFASPGAGATSVSLAGAPASGVHVLDDNRIAITTPAGVDVLGNPLAGVALSVTNALGTSELADAYVYTPALVAGDPPRVGETFRLHLFGEPGDFQDLYFGVPVPGFALPIAGIAGAFDLVGLSISPVSAAIATSHDTSFLLPVPNSPSLVGQSIDWQGFSLDSLAPLGGSFTNRLTTTFQG